MACFNLLDPRFVGLFLIYCGSLLVWFGYQGLRRS
jgi:hypothetical protein